MQKYRGELAFAFAFGVCGGGAGGEDAIGCCLLLLDSDSWLVVVCVSLEVIR